jgi:protein-S-isoprenylcysteine O-methyltransferase Ste14
LPSKVLASALRIITYTAVVVGFGLLCYSSYLKYRDTGSINWLGLVLVNAMFTAMYIARRDAISVTPSVSLWLLAVVATCLPLIAQSSARAQSAALGNIVQLVGVCAFVAAMLSLRRSFGIVPANRGIRTQGLYRVVRHPVYAAELLTFMGFAIANPSAWNFGILICEGGLQFTRACAEERFLSTDPVYSHYRTRVKYRLIPFII